MHCTIWAKQLFDVLFGPKDDEGIMKDILDTIDKDDKNKNEKVFSNLFFEEMKKLKEANEVTQPLSLPHTLKPIS